MFDCLSEITHSLKVTISWFLIFTPLCDVLTHNKVFLSYRLDFKMFDEILVISTTFSHVTLIPYVNFWLSISLEYWFNSSRFLFSYILSHDSDFFKLFFQLSHTWNFRIFTFSLIILSFHNFNSPLLWGKWASILASLWSEILKSFTYYVSGGFASILKYISMDASVAEGAFTPLSSRFLTVK